jgi:ABC-2 type transport system permease protein
MIQSGGIAWFARHEARLALRDWVSLMTAGHRRRLSTILLWFLALGVFLHALAYMLLTSSPDLTGPANRHLLAAISATLVASWSLMLSQAMESVTRAFYARGDLDLILTSPAAASKLFAVRLSAMAVTIMAMSLVLGAPFLNILIWLGGPHWIAGYGVMLALAISAVAVATAMTVGLFKTIGPGRTRAIAQVVSAVVGAAFAIGVQLVAILSYGSITRAPVARLDIFEGLAPDPGALLWWPARATVGELVPLVTVCLVSLLALVGAIAVFAPRFGPLVLATAGLARGREHHGRHGAMFQGGSPSSVLRRKEWSLLIRDPWLLSQTLMQLLYLLPAGAVLYLNFNGGGGAPALLVPILVLAAGQLGGGLAWLAVSGEDAPDLIATAPVPPMRILRAKAEAVIGGVLAVFAPILIVLGLLSRSAALAALVGILIAAACSTAIQYWFRTQAQRRLFRRRQTSSRIATFAEALSSTGWAGTLALAALGTWAAIVPAILVSGIVFGAWMISPSRGDQAKI